MRNITVLLDEEVARWARLRAAREDTSVSRLLGELLKEKMRAERRYDAARKAWLTVKPRALGSGGGLPSREELHDRARLR